MLVTAITAVFVVVVAIAVLETMSQDFEQPYEYSSSNSHHKKKMDPSDTRGSTEKQDKDEAEVPSDTCELVGGGETPDKHRSAEDGELRRRNTLNNPPLGSERVLLPLIDFVQECIEVVVAHSAPEHLESSIASNGSSTESGFQGSKLDAINTDNESCIRDTAPSEETDAACESMLQSFQILTSEPIPVTDIETVSLLNLESMGKGVDTSVGTGETDSDSEHAFNTITLTSACVSESESRAGSEFELVEIQLQESLQGSDSDSISIIAYSETGEIDMVPISESQILP